MKSQTVAVLMIIGFVLMLLVFIKSRTSQVSAPSYVTDTTILEGANALYVPDQSPGEAVFVSQVVLDRSGFVAIHNTDENDEPGEIIAVSELLISGTHEDVVVSIEGGTSAGDELYAMLHTDNGDGVFSQEDDNPLMSEEGNPILSSFEILPETTPEVSL